MLVLRWPLEPPQIDPKVCPYSYIGLIVKL